ncbi:universal stress protein [Deinococcus planocerae]|uniref:universal stress protein n=1 Tax=Deinococcus planocerae TaxID=1737569 RepID=UPI000C7F066B|nr:universal stress protein [Deinococcus planocerae]
MFERILVPLDFSTSAARALDTARTHFPGAHRRLLYVADSRRDYAASALDLLESGHPAASSADLARDELERQLEANETMQVVDGVPAEEILGVAREWGAELIVMGTHGRRGLAHLVLGSVAEAVVRGATVPVMTVRVVQATAKTEEPAGRTLPLRPSPSGG